jgi:hypothetical protein
MDLRDTQELRRLAEQHPFARWAYRSVTFDAADTDTPVDHEFMGVDPEEIRYTPLAIEGDAYVYQGLGTRNAATSTTIWLRASAPCRARLLLTVEHP